MHKTLVLILACAFLAASCGNNRKEEKPQPLDTSTLGETKKTEETASQKHPGESVYKSYCATCHQPNGMGVPGMYPPLSPNPWIENKDSLISVTLNGLQGKIEVNGDVYNNYMAPHGHLTDQELADVMSYVRSSFGNDQEPVTAAEIKAARKEK
jgi:mono/diheme cytochrome c family protein